MIAERHHPSAALQPFVSHYLIIESTDGLANRVLPDTSPIIAFRYKGNVGYTVNTTTDQLPAAVITGLRRSARIINYSENSANLLVIFKEAAAMPFFKAPIHELFGDSVALDNFFNRQQLSILTEQLAEASSNIQRVTLIEHFLLTQLNDRHTDDLVLAATQQIRLSKGLGKIKDLAGSFYISQDAFEKRFRRATGATPKQFSSIVRLRSLIHQNNDLRNLGELAYTAGYFDQAHFNKDFRLFTGQTPTDFFRSPLFW